MSKMTGRSTETERPLEQAADEADRLVGGLSAELSARRDSLATLLRRCEEDLHQIRLLIGDLSQAGSDSDATARVARWVGDLPALRRREAQLSADVEKLRVLHSRLVSAVEALRAGSVEIGLEAPAAARGREAVASQLLQRQEAERARLAREVHDGPAQAVANAIMGLEYCQRLLEKRPEAVEDELCHLKESMTEGLAEIRRFIFDLRPSSLEHEDLAVTLRRFAAHHRRLGPAIEIACHDVDGLLSREQRFGLFRIVQEAIQNARRHADASRVTVTVEREPSGVVVTVADDGCGFAADAPGLNEGHYGLQGMRERAEAMGASVTILSEVGRGTVVRLHVPLDVPGRSDGIEDNDPNSRR